MLPPDLLRSFCSELEKTAESDYHLRSRFKRLHGMLRNQGADVGAGMGRIHVSKDHLTSDDVERLGFKKVKVAVPEAGQVRVSNYRHPLSNHHLHDHGSHWVMHEDSHPSTAMLWEKIKMHQKGELKDTLPPHVLRKSKKATKILKKRKSGTEQVPGRIETAAATIKGMPHLIGEGGPGLYYYLKGRVQKSPGMLERVQKHIDPAVVKRMKRWRPSKSAREQRPPATVPHAHTPASPATTGAP